MLGKSINAPNVIGKVMLHFPWDVVKILATVQL